MIAINGKAGRDRLLIFSLLELITHAILLVGLYGFYPILLRISIRQRWRSWASKRPFFSIPTSFDPAPLLYPIFIPIFVSLSLTNHNDPALIMPNIILSLASLPAPVIPLHGWINGVSIPHWVVAMIPVLISEHFTLDHHVPKPLILRGHEAESLLLLFPLHQALIPTLDFLLTTSILPAELQLLTTALINLLLFASLQFPDLVGLALECHLEINKVYCKSPHIIL